MAAQVSFNKHTFYEIPSSLETIHFIRMIDRAFDSLNGHNLTECRLKRKPNLRPYRSPDDPQLQVIVRINHVGHIYTDSIPTIQWLEEDLLGHLDMWKRSIESLMAKRLMCLSKETQEGWQITSEGPYCIYWRL